MAKPYLQLPRRPAAQVELPMPLEAPIAALGEAEPGWICQEPECGSISLSRDKIRQHCNQRHGWRATKAQPVYWNPVHVQTFFRGGAERYFTVDTRQPVVSYTVSAAETPAQEQRVAVDLLLEEWQLQLQTRQKELQVADAEMAKVDRTGWWKRTGWPAHLARRNLEYLVWASRAPDKTEPVLQLIAQTTVELIDEAVNGLATLTHLQRRWLRSAKREEIDVRPLARLQEKNSQARYAGYLSKFVVYVCRVAWADLSTDERMRDACELFPWRGRQLELAQDAQQLFRIATKAQQIKHLLALLETFIFQDVCGSPFESGLVHFLAVLGINAELNRLRTANDFSYYLAGITYCIRVVAAEILLPASQRDDQAHDETIRFLDMRRKYLADGSNSPLSEVLSLLAYGKSAALNFNNAGSVFWSQGHDILYFRGQPIYIRRFRETIQGIIHDATNLLWRELFWMEDVQRFTIALHQITDDVSFTKRGISFVQQADNELDGGLAYMLQRTLESPAGRKLRRQDEWHVRRVRRYLRRVDDYLELLLFAVHVTGGQPARGTEILTLRHQNGFLQDRNVFVIDGQVVMVTRYHKSQALFDKPKVIPRFLPSAVAQLVAVYLAYVRPFREYLQVQLSRMQRAHQADEAETDNEDNHEGDEDDEHAPAPLHGWSDYIWADGDEPWTTDRLTRIIARETGIRLGVRLTTQDYRHVAVSIGRVFVGHGFASGYQEEGVEAEAAEVDEAEDALELSAGRGEAIGAARYGVRSDVVQHLSNRSLATFRPLCQQWHRFLGLDAGVSSGSTTPSLSTGSTLGKRSVDDEISPTPKRPRSTRDDSTLDQAVQQVLGQTTVSYRSDEQRDALQAILRGETPLVVVLPTGGGKSMLFMAPACVPDPGVTIVVVPYRALLENILVRLAQAGIEAIEWQFGQVNPAAVVVVSADVVGGGDFLTYAALLQTKGLLRRIVLDECHLAFTATTYRPKLAQLRQLRAIACPIILLTATLPPLLELELAESMLVPMARYIRARTIRPQTQYLVYECARGQLVEEGVAYVRRWQDGARRQPGRKGVIYCKSRGQCEAVAAELECGYYHGQSTDKTKQIQTWLAHGGLIVATGALGTGVDFPGIVFVLHLGIPYGMIDYAQESGRAGRGGEAVTSIILVEPGSVEATPRTPRTMDEAAMYRFVAASSCRRAVMSSYLDGIETSCDGAGGARCDQCGQGITDWQLAQAEQQQEEQRVRQALDEMAAGCAACWLGGSDSEHGSQGCTAQGLLQHEASLDSFRAGIWYEKESHSCGRCGISQDLCATGQGTEQRCQWPGVAVACLVWAMQLADEGSARWQGVLRRARYKGAIGIVADEEVAAEQERWQAYRSWVGRRSRQARWGRRRSNGMEVVIEAILMLDPRPPPELVVS